MIKKLDVVGETRMDINGEIINMENKKDVRVKLNKIYERGCLSIRTPEKMSILAVLVNQMRN